MAKRYTDSNKWKKEWFRQLPLVYKLVWIYLLDNCDHAGIWEVEWDVLSIRMKEDIKPTEAYECMKEKITVIDAGKKWFIPDFIEFQYGELNPNNQVHKSVIQILDKYDARQALTCPISGPKQVVASDDVKEVISYFNQVTGSKCKDTTVGNIHPISARLKEGYSVLECKQVILTKYQEWKNDPAMSKYITIETLFRPGKFDKYLNQKSPKEETGIRKYLRKD